MKKIYCLLSDRPYLTATAGDVINEINTMRALSLNYEVYYNNRRFDPSKPYYGTDPKDKISLPDKQYDYYYVRNNPKIFKQLPHPKFYFCVPNHQDCFKQADALVFPTQVWSDQLKSGKIFELFGDAYKKTNVFPKKHLVFNQITYPEDLSLHPKTVQYRSLFNKKNGKRESLVIGHFGRVVKSNLPTDFLRIIRRYQRVSKRDVKVVFAGNIRYPKLKRYVFKCIPFDDVKYAISACDVLLYNQDYQGIISGSLKIIDALNYGVPVITPKYQARVFELGNDYPYFADNHKTMIRALKEIEKGTNGINKYLWSRAEYFNLENSAKRFKQQIDEI